MLKQYTILSIIQLTFDEQQTHYNLHVQMNKHSMLIMHLIAVTSIWNKTKHTYTVQKIKQPSWR